MLLSASASSQSLFHTDIIALAKERDSLFPFGVASGDPRQEQVVLWTKVLPNDGTETVEVDWAIALDTNFAQVVNSGSVITAAASAYTVHVTVTGLEAGNTYYYRFRTGGHQSPMGRTRTAPANAENLRLAVVSCSNYPAGFFNVYALVAQQENIDAVIHLGDYIYESGSKGKMGREHIPPHEIITISDYRSRYAQYRLDPDLMEVHRLHPFIVIWDDHEFANDSHRDGADNHQPQEGDWETRKAIAKQAYFEWMPVENPENQSIVRSFNYGGLADLFMLDGRLERDGPVANRSDPACSDTSRSKLGCEQTEWLTNGLRDSRARWKILGNNVMFSEMNLGKFAKDRQWNMDAWDGYPANRNLIFDSLEANGIRDVLILTGDIHTAWGIELTRSPTERNHYHRRTGKGVIGAEFVAPSVSSSNLDEMKGKFVAKVGVSYMKGRKRNPHLRYVNLMDHGFMLLELTPDRASCQWIFSRTPKKQNLRTKRGRAWHFMHGGNRLKRGK